MMGSKPVPSDLLAMAITASRSSRAPGRQTDVGPTMEVAALSVMAEIRAAHSGAVVLRCD
jgi:hypothetical protein